MSNYHNVRTNGFASKREAARATELEMLQKAGVISDLRYQVKLELIPAIPKVQRAICYYADFAYIQENAAYRDWETDRKSVM